VSYYGQWQWCVLPLPLLPVYMHVLGASTRHTAGLAARVPTPMPRRGSGGPVGPSGSASCRPSRLCWYIYLRTIEEKWNIAAERKEVGIHETCPIARCDRGFKSCRSHKIGRPTDTFNGRTGLVSGSSTYEYDQIRGNPLK
jgi:hypothetical protein